LRLKLKKIADEAAKAEAAEAAAKVAAQKKAESDAVAAALKA
jgi:hypothetical protein